MDKTVWLIRHGESEANAGAATSMPDMIRLTDTGKNQALAAAEHFSMAPSLIAHSPFLRTKQTAEPLIDKFADAPVEIWPVQEFTYLDLEQCRDTTTMERKPLVMKYWEQADVHYCDSPDVESFSDLIDRVTNTLAKLHDAEHESIAVFTHEVFIKAIIWRLLMSDPELTSEAMTQFHHFNQSMKITNCGILKLNFAGPEISMSRVANVSSDPT